MRNLSIPKQFLEGFLIIRKKKISITSCVLQAWMSSLFFYCQSLVHSRFVDVMTCHCIFSLNPVKVLDLNYLFKAGVVGLYLFSVFKFRMQHMLSFSASDFARCWHLDLTLRLSPNEHAFLQTTCSNIGYMANINITEQ